MVTSIEEYIEQTSEVVQKYLFPCVVEGRELHKRTFAPVKVWRASKIEVINGKVFDHDRRESNPDPDYEQKLALANVSSPRSLYQFQC